MLMGGLYVLLGSILFNDKIIVFQFLFIVYCYLLIS